MAHGMEADFKVGRDFDGLGPSTGTALVTQLLSAPFLAWDAKLYIQRMVARVALGLPYGISDNDVPIPDTVHQQLSMCLKHKALVLSHSCLYFDIAG